MNGLIGDTVEKAISAPNTRNTMIGGTIHHNLFFQRYAAKSLIMCIFLFPN